MLRGAVRSSDYLVVCWFILWTSATPIVVPFKPGYESLREICSDQLWAEKKHEWQCLFWSAGRDGGENDNANTLAFASIVDETWLTNNANMLTFVLGVLVWHGSGSCRDQLTLMILVLRVKRPVFEDKDKIAKSLWAVVKWCRWSSTEEMLSEWTNTEIQEAFEFVRWSKCAPSDSQKVSHFAWQKHEMVISH